MKTTYHPKAFLTQKRNVRRGLTSRTRLIQILEKTKSNAKTVADTSELNYRVVIHHLRLLEAEGVVARRGYKKPFTWELTGAGQQRLVNPETA